jgi:hypothetical protein
MVEGVFSRASRGSLRPIELGRRLVREMDEHRSIDVKGRRIVPNHFTFLLTPSDRASFADINDALVIELCEAAREYARDEGYHFMGPVHVELTADPHQKSGRFAIESQMKEAGGGIGVGSLVLPTGERIELSATVITIGRLPECEITLNDSNISRRHAQVRPRGTGWVAADLGSTNGTKVNGVRIEGERLLREGDIISLGTTHIRFEAS